MLQNLCRLSEEEQDSKRKLEANLGVVGHDAVVSDRFVEEVMEEEDDLAEKMTFRKQHSLHRRIRAQITSSDDDDEFDKENETAIADTSKPLLQRKSSQWDRRRSIVLAQPSWKTTSPINWSNADVCDWIDQMGCPFSTYKTVFAQQKITGASLLELKESDLKEFCINNPVHRMELYRRMRGLKTSTLSGKQARMYFCHFSFAFFLSRDL
jgi:hypothetical protein